VQKLFVEPESGDDPYSISDADTMLRHIAPHARRPPRVVLFTRVHCPHSDDARQALERAGWHYVDFTLGDADRSFVLGALGNASTTPQIFIDGKLVGGADALGDHLRSQAHATAESTS
jgi:peroxiredoxin